jgi:chromosome segregation protein
MKLKSLEISGFKSFCEKSRIDFPEGISAIVGPNGCGKSNIVDALRWVMGEQSVKQLRGKSMEDVIFSGANGKPPLNMAEVTLTVANDNGSAPEELREFTEIMLTRRLYRSGESAYFLNKRPCRLKDIHNLFLGSGVGSKSYAVIQQGNIGAIIDAGPEERRYFIEEAAGTTRFKNRKNEALRKVEATHQNLLRVSDIITEIKRQMGGLKRQARKAERYKRQRQKAEELDIRLGLHQYADLTLQIDHTDRLLRELQDAELGHSSQLKQLDAAVEDIKLKRWQKDQEINTQKSSRFDLLRNIDRTENDLDHLRKDIERLRGETGELQSGLEDQEEKNSKIAAEIDVAKQESDELHARLADAQAELRQKQQQEEDIKSRLHQADEQLERSRATLMDLMAQEARYKNIHQNASNNRENLQKRLQRITAEASEAREKAEGCRSSQTDAQRRVEQLSRQIETLSQQLEEFRRSYDEKRQAFAQQVKEVQTLEFERNKVRSQFSALKKMEENFEWYREGVQAVMKADHLGAGVRRAAAGPGASDSRQQDRVIGLLADVIEPEPEFQTAVEAALGESLQYIIVRDSQTGIEAIEYLQSQAAGRSGFIPVQTVAGIDEDRRMSPNGYDPLLKHVKITAGYEKIAESLLSHVIVADDIQKAMELFTRNKARMSVVTRQGNMISRQGIMLGGSQEKLSGILAKKQELRDLEGQLQALDQRLETEQSTLQRMEQEVRTIENDLQKLAEEKRTAEEQLTDADKQLYRISEELKHVLRHLEIVELEQEQLLGEESDIDDEIARHRDLLAEVGREIEAAENEVTEKTGHRDVISAEMDDYNQHSVDLKLSLNTLRARLENSANTLRRLNEFQLDGRSRLDQLREEIERKGQRRVTSEKKVQDYESTLAGFYQQLKRVEETLEANEADFSSIDARLKDSDQAISELQDKREAIQQKVRVLEIEQTQRNVTRDNIAARLQEHYGRSIDEHRRELEEILKEKEATPEVAISTDELENELEKVRRKLAAIGDVNLGAINEYEELKSRHDFLSEQREDLQKAIEDLHRVIRKINHITQQRFMETYHKVNDQLGEVFPRLFEGGTAQLVLTEPDNPLETGVEYMIHPPGKKLTRMSLLSGGEKALAAIAFIFSLFLLKPTAFCLMDEIDAPLDDANVHRFSNLLKLIGEKSQIVMVTHNKRTMEFADMLLGITMETRGISKVVSVNLQ